MYGVYDIDIDIDFHIDQCRKLIDHKEAKITGFKNQNKFNRVPKDIQKELAEKLKNITKKYHDWNFDYFHSAEPVGLHTDYNLVPWDEKVDCLTEVGCIIPLEWNCKQPYTINYNKKTEIPRKMMYRNGEMRYIDNNEIFEYRSEYIYDEEVVKYNPKGTKYFKEYADLKVDSVYEWKIGTILIFDTSRWHSSSWFLSTEDLPDTPKEWKRSIIGFGSIDVQRN